MEQPKTPQGKAVKWILIAIGIVFLFFMLVMPLIVVLKEAFEQGWQFYKDAITDEYTVKALILTLKATVAAVLVNTIFGLFAAWTIRQNSALRAKNALDNTHRYSVCHFADYSWLDFYFNLRPHRLGIRYSASAGH